MSLATLKSKITDLIKELKFYRGIYDGTEMTGDYVMPDFAKIPQEYLVSSNDSLISFDTGKLTAIKKASATNYAIYYCRNLKVLKFPNVLRYSYYSAGNNTSLERIELSKDVIPLSMHPNWYLNNATSNKNVTTVTIPNGWNISLYLNMFKNLTVECLENIVDNLADLTGKTTQTFSIGNDNINKLSGEYINRLTTKNWNYK